MEDKTIRVKDRKDFSHRICKKGGVTFLQYQSLCESNLVQHGFSTRLGGVSQGEFATMNLSFTRGDVKEAVTENFRRMGEAIGVDYHTMVSSDQTHTTNVMRVGKEHLGNGITREKEFHDVDGLVTNVPNVTLATFYADCVPLFFLDPVHKAIGLSHSGWRGTVGRIGRKTVEKMEEEFQTNPKDLIVVIGPSICQDCYEVGEEVAREFRKEFPTHPDILRAKPDGKYQLDLWAANRYVLLEAHVEERQITMPNICTCCNPDFLFSHRASKARRGNLGAFLSLKEEGKSI